VGRPSKRTIKRVEKKVIQKLGQDVTIRRNQYSTDDTTGLDFYGEPLVPSGYTDYDERTIRIVVDEVKLVEELTTIGGITNAKKELLKCFISQSEEIAIGDIIYYPAGGTKAYEIDQICPYVLDEQVIVSEVIARRDITTK
jgi:hypothetical protein